VITVYRIERNISLSQPCELILCRVFHRARDTMPVIMEEISRIEYSVNLAPYRDVYRTTEAR